MGWRWFWEGFRCKRFDHDGVGRSWAGGVGCEIGRRGWCGGMLSIVIPLRFRCDSWLKGRYTAVQFFGNTSFEQIVVTNDLW